MLVLRFVEGVWETVVVDPTVVVVVVDVVVDVTMVVFVVMFDASAGNSSDSPDPSANSNKFSAASSNFPKRDFPTVSAGPVVLLDSGAV